ncbi:MAG: hypothetical protein ACE5JX_06590 [Acidobacteriota bacterium]
MDSRFLGWTILFFILVPAVAALIWSTVAGTPDGTESPIFFALAPAATSESPDASRDYPPGTRLFRWDRPGAADPVEALPGWTLFSPPAVSYDGKRVLLAARAAESRPIQIWELEVGASTPRRITRYPADCAAPRYLPDARIVFSGSLAGSLGESSIRPLFTCLADGSGLQRITFGKARDRVCDILPDGRILFQRTLLKRPSGLPALRLMTVNPDGTGLAGYAPPSPSPSAGRSGPRLASALPEATGESPLYALDGNGRSWKRLHWEEGFHALDPVEAVPRKLPAVATSVVNAKKRTGWLLCLNASVTRSGEGTGEGRPEKVRVREASTGRVLGESPIQEDGSFFLQVPADRLLGLETVDREGEPILRLQSGLWVRPNEHRGCIGCHEPRSWVPENRFPQALLRPPVKIGTALSPGEAGAVVEGQPDE